MLHRKTLVAEIPADREYGKREKTHRVDAECQAGQIENEDSNPRPPFTLEVYSLQNEQHDKKKKKA
jgi:hypothetical protein